MGRVSLSRCAPGLLGLGLGVSAPATTRAAALPSIEWDAPAGCPDAEVLRAEISRHLDPAAASGATGSIRVQARPDGAGWHVAVAIATDGRTQERTLAVASCDAAVRAAAFVIAIAVDPAQREPEDVVPAPPDPPTPSPPKPGPEPEAVSEGGPAPALAEVEAPPADAPLAPGSRAPRRRAVRGLVYVGPGVQVGMLPVQAGLAVGAGLVWPRARLTLGYARWFTTEVWRPGELPYGAEFAVHAGQLRGGPVLRAGPLELPLQAGLELGALQAAGLGGERNYTATALWGAATVGAGLMWAPRASRGFFAVGLLAEAAFALRRPQFVFEGDREIRRVGPAAFRGFLQVEARFP
ncbi:hypothetical protein OV090_11640 [Nannocystis sp. RBIL2]|uniref:hypothetical protein n=1 Tax=Nannocystis sp. RBIL2 TaxID=2996788 RepID=UPI002270706A|nr:hypothetical protein [Nannocystis sp. RBIL2]MCY1065420.1 hypothetical protein [Nannocystis sp. RBIL2]